MDMFVLRLIVREILPPEQWPKRSTFYDLKVHSGLNWKISWLSQYFLRKLTCSSFNICNLKLEYTPTEQLNQYQNGNYDKCLRFYPFSRIEKIFPDTRRPMICIDRTKLFVSRET